MAIENKQVQIAKEIDDVLLLLVEVAKDIKAGKDAAAIAAENLPNLINAIGGIDQAKAELEANKAVVMQTVGMRVGELASALVG